MMWKKFALILLLYMLVSALFLGCEPKEKNAFPPDSLFASEVRVISSKQTADGNYQLHLEAVLYNHDIQQSYTLYGNPKCWNILYINGKSEPQDLLLGSYTVEPGGRIIEEKIVHLDADTAIGSELYVISDFFIVNESGAQQRYAVPSNPIYISEEVFKNV